LAALRAQGSYLRSGRGNVLEAGGPLGACLDQVARENSVSRGTVLAQFLEPFLTARCS
jgi:hypothetical protein